MAISLEEVTRIPARIWNQYEALYREDLARLEANAAFAKQHEAAKLYPLAYLRKFGHIRAAGSDKAGTVRQLLSIFGVASLDALATTWAKGSVAYRRTVAGREDAPALETWLTLGERAAEHIDLAEFDGRALKSMLPDLRSLSDSDPTTYVADCINSLSRVGVALCLVPPMPGLGVYGATRWLNGRPIVQLSLRYKTDDQLWFTLFHEIGHILLHGENGLYLAGDGSTAEEEADCFAADLLIPKEFAERLPRRRDIAAVQDLAAELGIAPGIVLGRAQREMGDFAWGNDLKKRFEFVSMEGSK